MEQHLKQGSYPTSYIPTYGASVTRSLDSCVATSVSDGDHRSIQQGTLFVEFTIDNSAIMQEQIGFLVLLMVRLVIYILYAF